MAAYIFPANLPPNRGYGNTIGFFPTTVLRLRFIKYNIRTLLYYLNKSLINKQYCPELLVTPLLYQSYFSIVGALRTFHSCLQFGKAATGLFSARVMSTLRRGIQERPELKTATVTQGVRPLSFMHDPTRDSDIRLLLHAVASICCDVYMRISWLISCKESSRHSAQGVNV